MIEKITDLAKKMILDQENVKIAVDMTAGTGKDSLFILENLEPDLLYSFDIQDEAERKTKSLIGPRKNFKFIKDGHQNIDKHITEKIDLGVYNLGYLPGSDQQITTRSQTTIESLDKLLKLLNKNGRIVLTIYRGHKEGNKEAKEIETYLGGLEEKDYACLKLSYPNKGSSSPYIITIDKKF